MNEILIDLIGYLAIIINLYSMSSKGEYKLRLIALIANLAFILYGTLILAIPIIAGASIAVFLHANRLTRIRKTRLDG